MVMHSRVMTTMFRQSYGYRTLKRDSATHTPVSEVPREPEAFKLPTKRSQSFYGDYSELSNFIEVFNANVEGKGYSDITNWIVLNINTKERVVPISTIVVDYLPNYFDIPWLAKTSKIPIKHHIPLANTFPSSDRVSDISILLGTDNLNKFLQSYQKFKNINHMKTNLHNTIWGQLLFASSDFDSQVIIVSSFRTEVLFVEYINNSHLSLINKDNSSSLSLPKFDEINSSLTSLNVKDQPLNFFTIINEEINSQNSTEDLDRL